jgi:hypothetical protein
MCRIVVQRVTLTWYLLLATCWQSPHTLLIQLQTHHHHHHHHPHHHHPHRLLPAARAIPTLMTSYNFHRSIVYSFRRSHSTSTPTFCPPVRFTLHRPSTSNSNPTLLNHYGKAEHHSHRRPPTHCLPLRHRCRPAPLRSTLRVAASLVHRSGASMRTAVRRAHLARPPAHPPTTTTIRLAARYHALLLHSARRHTGLRTRARVAAS